MPTLSEIEFKILQIIKQENSPVGSGTISVKMSMEDGSLSEASVGRILRNLDQKGFTKKVGFQGRLITLEGLKEIEKYQLKKEKENNIDRFINLTRVEKKNELIDILVARRAIERETASLAATNVTPEDIEKMEEIILCNEELVGKGLSGAEEDVQFHQLIAKIAGNKILEAALNMIRKDAQLSPVLEAIRKQVGGTVVEDHKNIFSAIKNKQPKKAEKAMEDHINNLISDVNKYWEKVQTKKKEERDQ